VQSDTRRAAIAYVLASAYWGQGFGTQAIQAMIAELNAYYKVRRLTAVLKRENYRSLRLLERLQFSCATRRQHTEFRVGEGELLMLRNLQRQSIFAA
jgi:ribosomal-protein-alanine N-acetyltransferase